MQLFLRISLTEERLKPSFIKLCLVLFRVASNNVLWRHLDYLCNCLPKHSYSSLSFFQFFDYWPNSNTYYKLVRKLKKNPTTMLSQIYFKISICMKEGRERPDCCVLWSRKKKSVTLAQFFVHFVLFTSVPQTQIKQLLYFETSGLFWVLGRWDDF